MPLGNQNQLDIQIMSTFNPAGFIAAKEAMAMLGAQMGNMRVVSGQMATTFQQTGKSIGTMGTYMGKSFINMSRDLRTAQVEANRVSASATYMGQSIGTASQQFPVAGGRISSFADVGARSTEKVGGAFNNLTGYMRNVVKQTVSVGDVFGFYIGTQALQAVYSLTIGVSSLRNEMETTLEYMGNSRADVQAFSSEIQKFAIAMPKLSIAGAFTMAKQQVMAGASMSDVEKFKQQWADMATIAASLNDISPEVAAQKTGPAIADAVAGQYKRLQNTMNVTTDQFRAKAKELGFSNADLQGNYVNTMTVIKSILDERGLTGISGKLTSFADAWDFMAESITGTSSMAMNGVIEQLSPFIIALGKAIQAIPGPIMLAILGFVGLIATILVVMPIIGALVTSFSIVTAVFMPLLTRIEAARLGMKGFSKVAADAVPDSTINKFKRLDDEIKKTGQPMSKSSIAHADDGTQYMRTQRMNVEGKPQATYYKQESAGMNTLTASNTKMNNEGNRSGGIFNRMKNSVTGAGSSIRQMGSNMGKTNSYFPMMNGQLNQINRTARVSGSQVTNVGRELGTLGGSANKSGANVGRFSGILGKIGSPLGALRGGIGGLISGIGGLGKAVLTFMLTDPIGWIILIVMAVVMALQYFNQWDNAMKLITNTFNAIMNAVKPVVTAIFNLGKAGATSVAGWSGWKTIGNWIMGAYKAVSGFFSYVAGTFIVGKNSGEMMKWLGSAFGELQSAASGVMGAYGEMWTALQPVIGELGTAFQQLINVIWPVGDAIQQTGGAIGPPKQQMTMLGGVVHILVVAFQLLAWGMKNIGIPIIKAMIPVLIALVGGLKNTIQFITWLYQGFLWLDKVLKPVGGALTLILGPFMAITNAAMLLWHWITGNSPGLIPAFQELLAIAMGVFPMLASIIQGAVERAISTVSRFVSNTVSFFRTLPGRVYSALSTLGSQIVAQLQNAYNSAMAWVGNFAKIGQEIYNKVVDAIKGFFHISSPSKKTAELGQAISEGLYVGMKQWIDQNSDAFYKNAAAPLMNDLKKLSDAFANYKFKFYFNSLQGVSATLKNMSGNCSDAADAYMSMANNMGLATRKIHTSVNGIGHYVVGLDQVGMWIDPSGILGKGYHALGTGGIAGSSNIINVYQSGNNIRDSVDSQAMANDTSRRILQSVRFGI